MNMSRIWGTLDPFYEPGPVVGRRMANAQFLRALLARDPFDEYHFFFVNSDSCDCCRDHFEKVYSGIWVRNRIKLFHRIELPRRLRENSYYCFHQSDCILFPMHIARLRNLYSERIFPITGVTHSLSNTNVAESILRHIWPGASARDCIIATSTTGCEVVRRFIRCLRSAYGLDTERFPEPAVERIPLGIDTAEFTPLVKSIRSSVRQKLGIGPQHTMLLVFGRIEYDSKMDMVPLFRAVQRLSRDGTDTRLMKLVIAGWITDESRFPELLHRMARHAGIDLVIVPRPTEKQKIELYGAGDIFLSPVDNPQETFGITVVEAGAMGLPVIASDYDGYRDLIRHDVTGLRIPTMGASRTRMIDALAPVCFDNQYHLLLAQQTVVDVGALAAAIKGLLEDRHRRRQMGRDARDYVLQNFSWDSVISMYLALWDRLWKREVERKALGEAAHPSHTPYADIFGCHTSSTVSDEMVVVWSTTGQSLYRGQDFTVVYGVIDELVSEDIVKKMLFLARYPVTYDMLVKKMVERIPGCDRERSQYIILWSLKHDFLECAQQ